MSQGICSQCGGEIEGVGIRHRGRLFCSDDCCETFEEEFLTKGEPRLDDLGDEEFEFDDEEFEDEELEEDEEEDLGFGDEDET